MTTIATDEMTVIHANVFDPTGFRLFKGKANDKAECQTIRCSNTDCPLLKRGECYMRGGLFGQRCPYGQSRCEVGPTKRANSFYSWMRERKEKYKDVPFLKAPASKMEFIGDYVLLPYAHMEMCEKVPKGIPWLPISEWTIENVVSLVAFRPKDWFCHEIPSYQREHIPSFLLHLRESDPSMWSQLVAVMPHLDVAPNHVGRKALLSTIKSPLTWTEDCGKGYPVTWSWDGETLTTDSMNSFSDTWGRIQVDSVLIHAKPRQDSTVVIQSNDWVTPETVFVT